MANFCLIGEKLGHSLSPDIHRALGYDYDLVELLESEVQSFVKDGDYQGFNVTIPYKKTVIPYLDWVDETALEIGAVNTVVRRDGKLYGYNTDVLGMKYALDSAGIELKGKKVMILGSGGTSLTASYLAKTSGAREIVVVSRTGKVNYSNYFEHADTEVIINTTPVGMYPNTGESVVDLDKLPNLSGGFDAIYNPLHTPLIARLKEKGVPCSNGLKMLVGQAKYAKDLFLGTITPNTEIERIYRILLDGFYNLTLIGMPGCGKSTIGKELALALGKDFIDTDEEIERQEGTIIPEIFESVGEKGFREKESRVVDQVTKERGRVISFGGGAILNKRNVECAKQNGLVVYVVRELAELSTDGRPLSSSEERIKELFRVRKPLYEGYADITVQNDTTIEDVVNKILEKINENPCD